MDSAWYRGVAVTRSGEWQTMTLARSDNDKECPFVTPTIYALFFFARWIFRELLFGSVFRVFNFANGSLVMYISIHTSEVYLRGYMFVKADYLAKFAKIKSRKKLEHIRYMTQNRIVCTVQSYLSCTLSRAVQKCQNNVALLCVTYFVYRVDTAAILAKK